MKIKAKKGRTKLKTHRGAAKRFKITKTGKVLAKSAGLRHILTKRSSKNKRKKRALKVLTPVEAKRVRRMLPYFKVKTKSVKLRVVADSA